MITDYKESWRHRLRLKKAIPNEEKSHDSRFFRREFTESMASDGAEAFARPIS